MARLTKTEQRLLRYPPTEGTWVCPGKLRVNGEKCGTYNTARAKKCALCGRSKPQKPKLLWPEYEKACAKAEIEPGDRWRPSAEPETPKRTTRRKKG